MDKENKNENYMILQTFSAIMAMSGALLTGMLITRLQLLGFCLFFVANISSLFLFYKKKMWVILFQQVVFTILSINGIIQRII